MSKRSGSPSAKRHPRSWARHPRTTGAALRHRPPLPQRTPRRWQHNSDQPPTPLHLRQVAGWCRHVAPVWPNYYLILLSELPIIGPRQSTATAMVKHPSVTYGVVGPHRRSPHSSLIITRQLLPRWRAGEPSRRVATTVVTRLGQVPSPLWHFSPSSDVGRQVRWIIPVGQIWPKWQEFLFHFPKFI
jgi:hypothetical protein